jgi:hypothetical protein
MRYSNTLCLETSLYSYLVFFFKYVTISFRLWPSTSARRSTSSIPLNIGHSIGNSHMADSHLLPALDFWVRSRAPIRLERALFTIVCNSCSFRHCFSVYNTTVCNLLDQPRSKVKRWPPTLWQSVPGRDVAVGIISEPRREQHEYQNQVATLELGARYMYDIRSASGA